MKLSLSATVGAANQQGMNRGIKKQSENEIKLECN